jgi:hypothetical protein
VRIPLNLDDPRVIEAAGYWLEEWRKARRKTVRRTVKNRIEAALSLHSLPCPPKTGSIPKTTPVLSGARTSAGAVA